MSSVVGEPEIHLIKLRGRTYRKASTKSVGSGSKDPIRHQEVDVYEDEDTSSCKIQADYDIEKDESTSNYKLTTKVAPVFFKFVIGKKNASKIKIQSDTGCTITFPKPESGSDEVVIRGPSENAVISAKTRIDVIVDQSVKMVDWSHMICLPFADPTVQSAISSVSDQISQKFSSSRGFHPSLLIGKRNIILTLFNLK